MSLRTLARFLIGRRDAILEIAATPGAVWIGLALVLSAAFAREYDRIDFRTAPWMLLLPFAASLGTSFVLYLLVYAVAWRRHAHGLQFLGGYRSFLALYWSTAPLAWLYAIPYERFLSELDAARANLATLGLVAFWRVLLMIRVVQAITGATPFLAAIVVLFFAASVLVPAGLLVGQEAILVGMGGIQPPPGEALLHNSALLVGLLALIAWPVLLILLVGVSHVQGRVWQWQIVGLRPLSLSRGVSMMAFGSIAIWLLLAYEPQREQRLATQLASLLRKHQIDAAVDLLSSHARSDLPPNWDPSPSRTSSTDPTMLEVFAVVAHREVPDWLADAYCQKLASEFARNLESQMSNEETFTPYWFAFESSDLGKQAARLARDEAAKVLVYSEASQEAKQRVQQIAVQRDSGR